MQNKEKKAGPSSIVIQTNECGKKKTIDYHNTHTHTHRHKHTSAQSYAQSSVSQLFIFSGAPVNKIKVNLVANVDALNNIKDTDGHSNAEL